MPSRIGPVASWSGALEEACAGLVSAGARLHRRGLLAGTEGNLSLRLADGTILATPAGADKGLLAASTVVRLHADGTPCHTVTGNDPVSNVDSGALPAGASSEIRMHLRLFAHRDDVGAVVHAHPPAATGFASAARPLPDNVLPELIVNVGPVAFVPYARPGTDALPDAMMPFLESHNVFLLANHGVTTVGRTLREAVHRMESCEQGARILLASRLLGGAAPLPDGEATALDALRRRANDAPLADHLEFFA